MNFKTEKLIYIGPTLRGKQVLQYQVFIGGIPEILSGTVQQNPWMKALFVPIEEFEAKRKEADRKGTPLYQYYRKAMEV